MLFRFKAGPSGFDTYDDHVSESEHRLVTPLIPLRNLDPAEADAEVITNICLLSSQTELTNQFWLKDVRASSSGRATTKCYRTHLFAKVLLPFVV